MIILGIDFGTSNSAAAVVNKDGKIIPIPSSKDSSIDQKPFPSVVSFSKDGEMPKVGKDALEQSVYNPKGTVFDVKSQLGSGKLIKIFDEDKHPEYIAALILVHIKICAIKFLKEEISNAVITVPAYFNDNQRRAIKLAGTIAGLEIMQIINEPVAASIAYGLKQLDEPTKIMVFDMGAGTLDVSVVEVDGSFFEVQSTAGATDIGGNTIDDILEKFLLDEVSKIKKDAKEDVIDEFSRLQIRQLAESIKIRLSEEDEISINDEIPLKNSSIILDLSLDRTAFESMIEPVLKGSEICILDAIKGANIDTQDIGRVILVGGPTQIPAIKNLLTKIIKEPEEKMDSTFAVATGAAIQAAVLADTMDLPVLYQNLTLLQKTQLDLGEHAKSKGRHIIELMIPRNTTYPIQYTKSFFVNKIAQKEVQIDVWQGDFEKNPDFERNSSIGQFWLRGLRQGIQNEVAITYTIDADGILTITASERYGDARTELSIDQTREDNTPAEMLEQTMKEIQEEVESIEKHYRHDYMSPYENPVDEFQHDSSSQEESLEYNWMCSCLAKAKDILARYHNVFDPSFFDVAEFELFLQLDKQYAFAYIQLNHAPYYPIGIHNTLKENTRENQRMLVITLVHELLHAIHPDWGHNRIRPEERRLANMAGYYDTYREKEVKFLSGQMSLCNNSMTGRERKIRIQCR